MYVWPQQLLQVMNNSCLFLNHFYAFVALSLSMAIISGCTEMEAYMSGQHKLFYIVLFSGEIFGALGLINLQQFYFFNNTVIIVLKNAASYSKYKIERSKVTMN